MFLLWYKVGRSNAHSGLSVVLDWLPLTLHVVKRVKGRWSIALPYPNLPNTLSIVIILIAITFYRTATHHNMMLDPAILCKYNLII